MKTAELRKKDVAGLKTEVKDLQKAHFGLRMQKATQQLTNTGTLRVTHAVAKKGHSATPAPHAARPAASQPHDPSDLKDPY